MAILLHPSLAVHPGPWARAELLAPYALTDDALATMMGVDVGGLTAFLDGEADLSADMARRLAKVFGVSAGALLRMQERARKRPPGEGRPG